MSASSTITATHTNTNTYIITTTISTISYVADAAAAGAASAINTTPAMTYYLRFCNEYAFPISHRPEHEIKLVSQCSYL